MTRSGVLAFIVAATALGAAAATAQPTTPENGDGRFTFHRSDDGYVRLDGKTGQVSVCRRRPSGWQCQTVPDERSAFEAEVARLQGENAALKKELLSRNLALPGGARPEPPAPNKNVQRPQGHQEPEISRVRRLIENVWRRIVEMIASVQRDILKRT